MADYTPKVGTFAKPPQVDTTPVPIELPSEFLVYKGRKGNRAPGDRVARTFSIPAYLAAGGNLGKLLEKTAGNFLADSEFDSWAKKVASVQRGDLTTKERVGPLLADCRIRVAAVLKKLGKLDSLAIVAKKDFDGLAKVCEENGFAEGVWVKIHKTAERDQARKQREVDELAKMVEDAMS